MFFSHQLCSEGEGNPTTSVHELSNMRTVPVPVLVAEFSDHKDTKCHQPETCNLRPVNYGYLSDRLSYFSAIKWDLLAFFLFICLFFWKSWDLTKKQGFNLPVAPFRQRSTRGAALGRFWYCQGWQHHERNL